MVELLLAVQGDVRGGIAVDDPAVSGGAEAVLGVVGDLLRALVAAELVDARVLGDLIDPRLERDRAVGVAHAAQRRHEDVLGQVLRAGVVLDHAEDVRGDPPVIAVVELLEGTVVSAAQRGNELGISLYCSGARGCGRKGYSCFHSPELPCRPSLAAEGLSGTVAFKTQICARGS